MTYFLVFATSAVVTLVAGAVVRQAAIRLGAVVPLRPDRWHRNPTPTFGGIAVLAGLAVAVVTQLPVWIPDPFLMAAVMAAGLGLFAIGWYDDVRPFSAVAKIVNSLAAAAFFVFVLSRVLPAFQVGPISVVASLVAILWFAGLDNAINLLDNMDGLATGVSAIAAVGLAMTFRDALGPGLVMLLVALAGSLVGFLVWNRQPAKLFMGNCGSLAIGGILAACSTIAVARVGTLEAAAAAVLILIAPVFDTGFVMLLRWLAGRSTTAGNIDHTSHRLVSAGCSERGAVHILYALAAAGAVGGYFLFTHGLGTWPVGVVVALGALFLGLYLARVPAYSGQDFKAFQGNPFAPLLSGLTMKWHVGEVLLDLALITLCYYSAYHLRFEGNELNTFLWSFRASLPLMLGCQIAALYASGLYSRAWSTFGFHDFWPVVRGVGLGSMAAILLVNLIYKNTAELERFSRGVWIIDAVLLAVAIIVSRLSFRILRGVTDYSGTRKSRVMIYGAGTRGQLLVREMLANPEWERNPVGFLDDDPSKHGQRLLGVPVHGSVDALADALRKYSVEEVLLSSPSINGTIEARVREICGGREIPVRRLHLEIQ
jgi:UDP-GlcNAc:undecaprenyl-phosphate GlcNAc-1-phosphate transferase